MTSPTVPDGFPFPIQGDLPTAQSAFELAMAVDLAARNADLAFTALYKPAAFVYRVTPATAVNFAGVTPWGNLTIEWDTSGGTMTGFGWQQSFTEPASWWMFGVDQMITNTAGVPNVADHIGFYFGWQTFDPVTLTSQPTAYNQGFALNQETNTGGEYLSRVTVLPVYQSVVNPFVAIFGPGTPTRQLAADSRFWGVRLGPVAL